MGVGGAAGARAQARLCVATTACACRAAPRLRGTRYTAAAAAAGFHVLPGAHRLLPTSCCRVRAPSQHDLGEAWLLVLRPARQCTRLDAHIEGAPLLAASILHRPAPAGQPRCLQRTQVQQPCSACDPAGRPVSWRMRLTASVHLRRRAARPRHPERLLLAVICHYQIKLDFLALLQAPVAGCLYVALHTGSQQGGGQRPCVCALPTAYLPACSKVLGRTAAAQLLLPDATRRARQRQQAQALCGSGCPAPQHTWWTNTSSSESSQVMKP